MGQIRYGQKQKITEADRSTVCIRGGGRGCCSLINSGGGDDDDGRGMGLSSCR